MVTGLHTHTQTHTQQMIQENKTVAAISFFFKSTLLSQHCHFCSIYLGHTEPAVIQYEEVNSRRWWLLGAILETGYHRMSVNLWTREESKVLLKMIVRQLTDHLLSKNAWMGVRFGISSCLLILVLCIKQCDSFNECLLEFLLCF